MTKSNMAWLRVAWLCMLCGCTGSRQVPQYAANWDKLRVGMPRLEAQELLGEPYRASYRKDVSTPYEGEPASPLDAERQALLQGAGGAEPNWSQRWQFGRFGLRDWPDLANGSDKAFIVWIDDWGRVLQFRRPIAGPFAAQSQPGTIKP